MLITLWQAVAGRDCATVMDVPGLSYMILMCLRGSCRTARVKQKFRALHRKMSKDGGRWRLAQRGTRLGSNIAAHKRVGFRPSSGGAAISIPIYPNTFKVVRTHSGGVRLRLD